MHSWKERIKISIGHTLEIYDIAVYAAIAFYVGKNFFPESAFGDNASWYVWMTFALRFFARPIGGIVIGMLADKHGRRAALMLSSSLTGVATLIMACLPSYEQIGILAPCLFVLMQMFQTFSFGGEHPTTTVYLLENAQKNQYARLGILLSGVSFLTVVVAFGIIFLMKMFFTEAQMIDFGWRIPLIIGLLNIVFCFYVRFRLSESKNFQSSKGFKVQPLATFKIFFMIIPTSIIFYGNAISSKMLVSNLVQDPILQSGLPVALNILFFVACCVAGFLIDRYSNCMKSLKVNYLLMIVFSIPIYALQDLNHVGALIVSQLCITCFAAVSMCGTMPVIFEQTSLKDRIATIGLGTNVGVVLFGGFAPFCINYLSQYGQAYVGLIMSFGGLCFFVALALDKYAQTQSQRTQTA